MKTLAIIPARYGSTRFPGKPLIDINGKSMIQRVFEKATMAKSIDKVIVATDDQRIYDHVISFEGEVMMTGANHESGTDRCGEVANLLSEYTTIVNLQGDEPFVPAEMIDELVSHFRAVPNQKIATLARLIDDPAYLFSTNIVKVVLDHQSNALYFSRHPIPYQQGVLDIDWINNHDYYKHVGMYIFDRDTLLDIVSLPTGKLEEREKLEQLRWLENGYKIKVGLTKYESLGIDTPQDLERMQS